MNDPMERTERAAERTTERPADGGEGALGEALLSQYAGGAPGGAADRLQALVAIDRQRRRLRWLAGSTVFFWLLAAAGVLVFHFGFLTFFVPKLNYLMQHPTPANARQWNVVFEAFGRAGTPVVVTSAGSMLLAALGTVWYVTASRRATLHQIAASLAEISEQIRKLQGGPRGAGGA